MVFVEPGVHLIVDLMSTVGYSGLAALMALDATILPVPSAAVLGFAGYLSYTGRFDLLFVVVIGALGSTAGSLLMYGLGRWGGRPFVDRFGGYVGLGDKRMNAAARWFARYGDWAVFVSQLLPIARDLIPFPAGILRMNSGRFALLSFLGSLPFCFVLAYIGYIAGPSWESAVDLVDSYDALLLAVVALFVLFFIIYRRMNKVNVEDGPMW
jgi:membrane protein DedA with SNARE-associated domain